MRPELTSHAQRFTPGVPAAGAMASATSWVRRFGADNPRVLRYMTFFPWVHPDVVPERQEILAKIYAFYRFYDDFNDSLHSDLHTSRTVANQMIRVLDGERPASDAAVLWMFHSLWQAHEQVCPPEFLARSSMHWRHYFATQSIYHAMRSPDYPWDLADYLSLRIDNGGLHLAVSQAELANTSYIPAHVYRIPALVTMRRLTYYCVIVTNDLYSALRDREIDDHRNPVAQHMRHQHTGWDEAFVFVQQLLFDPDRWTPGRSPLRTAYLPFGAGAHGCPGDFALAELILLVAAVARRWHIRPDTTAAPRPGTILTPAPVTVTVVARTAAPAAGVS